MKRSHGDFKSVLEQARLRGWCITHTRGGHLRLTHPNGGLYHTAVSPSDWRVARNVDKALRRIERGDPPGPH